MFRRLKQIGYQVREQLAYSRPGKAAATLLRDVFYPKERVHWVQQRLAELRFSK